MLVELLGADSLHFYVALAYFDRFFLARPDVAKTWANMKIYFACLCISIKFLEDSPYRNQSFADLIQMEIMDFNKIER